MRRTGHFVIGGRSDDVDHGHSSPNVRPAHGHSPDSNHQQNNISVKSSTSSGAGSPRNAKPGMYVADPIPAKTSPRFNSRPQGIPTGHLNQADRLIRNVLVGNSPRAHSSANLPRTIGEDIGRHLHQQQGGGRRGAASKDEIVFQTAGSNGSIGKKSMVVLRPRSGNPLSMHLIRSGGRDPLTFPVRSPRRDEVTVKSVTKLPHLSLGMKNRKPRFHPGPSRISSSNFQTPANHSSTVTVIFRPTTGQHVKEQFSMGDRKASSEIIRPNSGYGSDLSDETTETLNPQRPLLKSNSNLKGSSSNAISVAVITARDLSTDIYNGRRRRKRGSRARAEERLVLQRRKERIGYDDGVSQIPLSVGLNAIKSRFYSDGGLFPKQPSITPGPATTTTNVITSAAEKVLREAFMRSCEAKLSSISLTSDVEAKDPPVKVQEAITEVPIVTEKSSRSRDEGRRNRGPNRVEFSDRQKARHERTHPLVAPSKYVKHIDSYSAGLPTPHERTDLLVAPSKHVKHIDSYSAGLPTPDKPTETSLQAPSTFKILRQHNSPRHVIEPHPPLTSLPQNYRASSNFQHLHVPTSNSHSRSSLHSLSSSSGKKRDIPLHLESRPKTNLPSPPLQIAASSTSCSSTFSCNSSKYNDATNDNVDLSGKIPGLSALSEKISELMVKVDPPSLGAASQDEFDEDTDSSRTDDFRVAKGYKTFPPEDFGDNGYNSSSSSNHHNLDMDTSKSDRDEKKGSKSRGRDLLNYNPTYPIDSTYRNSGKYDQGDLGSVEFCPKIHDNDKQDYNGNLTLTKSTKIILDSGQKDKNTEVNIINHIALLPSRPGTLVTPRKCSKCKQLAKQQSKHLMKIKNLQKSYTCLEIVINKKHELNQTLQLQIKNLTKENQQLAKAIFQKGHGGVSGVSSGPSVVQSSSSVPNLQQSKHSFLTSALGFYIPGKSATSPVASHSNLYDSTEDKNNNTMGKATIRGKSSSKGTPSTFLISVQGLSPHRKVSISCEHLKEAEEKIQTLWETCQKLTQELETGKKEQSKMSRFLSNLLFTLNGRGYEQIQDGDGNTIDLNRCKGEEILEIRGRDQRMKPQVRRLGANDCMLKAVIGSQESVIQNLILQLDSYQREREILLGNKLRSLQEKGGKGGGRDGDLETEILELMTLVEGACQRYPDVFLALREQHHLATCKNTAGQPNSRREKTPDSSIGETGIVLAMLERCEQGILARHPKPGYRAQKEPEQIRSYRPKSQGKKRPLTPFQRQRRKSKERRTEMSTPGPPSPSPFLRKAPSSIPNSRSTTPTPRGSLQVSSLNKDQEKVVRREPSQPIIPAEFTDLPLKDRNSSISGGRSGSGTLDNHSNTRDNTSHPTTATLTQLSTSLRHGMRKQFFTDARVDKTHPGSDSPTRKSHSLLEKGSRTKLGEGLSNSAMEAYIKTGRSCPYCATDFDPSMSSQDIYEHLEEHLFSTE